MHRIVIIGLVTLILATTARAESPATQPAFPKRDDTAAEKLGWRLGFQAYTFRDRSFFETIELAQAMGIKYIEGYPGQNVKKDGKEKFDVGLTPAERIEVKEYLAAHHVKLMNFGVTGAGTEADWRKLFDFARDTGIQTLVVEPDENSFDMLDKLVREYDIKLALHDHPKPAKYWDPNHVMETVKGHDARIGACADLGHWMTNGFTPVEALNICDGRVISFHFKEKSKIGGGGGWVPTGTGAGHMEEVTKWMKDKNWKGVLSIEYEAGKGAELEANVQKCIAWFDEQARMYAPK